MPLQGTLSSYVYDDLVSKICRGEYHQRQKLPSEAALCEHYKVSRPVVRAALMHLRDNGFIESIRGVGSFVKTNSRPNYIQMAPIDNYQDIMNCFDFRVAIEGPMAYCAALNANANDKIAIQRAYTASENTNYMNGKTEMELDLNFHLAIAQATHNRFYVQALQTVSIQILEGMAKIASFFSGNKVTHNAIKDREHGLTLEGILKGNAPMAKAAIEMHLIRSKQWLDPVQKG